MPCHPHQHLCSLYQLQVVDLLHPVVVVFVAVTVVVVIVIVNLLATLTYAASTNSS